MNLRDSLPYNDIHSYHTRFSEVLYIPNENTTQFGINTLSFGSAKLSNKFDIELLNKNTNLAKSKLKALLRTNFPKNNV